MLAVPPPCIVNIELASCHQSECAVGFIGIRLLERLIPIAICLAVAERQRMSAERLQGLSICSEALNSAIIVTLLYCPVAAGDGGDFECLALSTHRWWLSLLPYRSRGSCERRGSFCANFDLKMLRRVRGESGSKRTCKFSAARPLSRHQEKPSFLRTEVRRGLQSLHGSSLAMPKAAAEDC
jgi:hypothetical protein